MRSKGRPGLDENRITTLEGDGDGKTSIDIFLSQSSFVQNRPTVMVAQVYHEDEEDLQGFVMLDEDKARQLRNHLDAFLRYCEKERARKYAETKFR